MCVANLAVLEKTAHIKCLIQFWGGFVPKRPKPLAPVVTRIEFDPENTTRQLGSLKRTGSDFPTRIPFIAEKLSNLQGIWVWPLLIFYGFLCEIYFYIAAKRLLFQQQQDNLFFSKSFPNQPWGTASRLFNRFQHFFSGSKWPALGRQTIRFRLMPRVRRFGAMHSLMKWDLIKHRGTFNFVCGYKLTICI